MENCVSVFERAIPIIFLIKRSLVSKQKTEGVVEVPVIPDEVIHYNRLTQLPPKSVVKFKSVCKRWYNLTNCISFRETHQNYTLGKSADSTDLLLVSSWKNYHSQYNKVIMSLLYTYLDAPHFVSGTVDAIIDINDQGTDKISRIVGSCNGLVCVKLDQVVSGLGYILYNPVTRECSGLIKNHSFNYPLGGHNDIYGFGYDYLSGDYKIVSIKIYYNRDQFQGGKCVEGAFYNTSNNSWKQYRHILDQSILQNRLCVHGGKVVNNKLHWMLASSILTFDLYTDEIGEMTLSTQLQQLCRKHKLDLMVSTDGRLFIVVTPTWPFESTEIWVMKRYGEAKSWMMCCNINAKGKKIEVIGYRSPREGRDEILLLNDRSNQLFWYNTENKLARKVGGDSYTPYSWLCTPTLAPIPIINLA